MSGPTVEIETDHAVSRRLVCLDIDGHGTDYSMLTPDEARALAYELIDKAGAINPKREGSPIAMVRRIGEEAFRVGMNLTSIALDERSWLRLKAELDALSGEELEGAVLISVLTVGGIVKVVPG